MRFRETNEKNKEKPAQGEQATRTQRLKEAAEAQGRQWMPKEKHAALLKYCEQHGKQARDIEWAEVQRACGVEVWGKKKEEAPAVQLPAPLPLTQRKPSQYALSGRRARKARERPDRVDFIMGGAQEGSMAPMGEGQQNEGELALLMEGQLQMEWQLPVEGQ